MTFWPNKKSLPVFCLLFFFCLFLFPLLSRAAVKEVTLFPNSAKVEETIKIPSYPAEASSPQATIILPPQADPDSLIVSPPAGSPVKIDDIRIKSLERVDEKAILQLRAQIKKLQNEKQGLQTKLKAFDMQLQFWRSQTKAKTKTVPEADNLASAIGRNSRKIYSDKFTAETELAKIDKQIKELQDDLHRTTGKSEKVWEATVFLSGAAFANTILNYAYILEGCGWQPLYRLEAKPDAKSVFFSWDAEVWQSTGEDWKLVQLNLATLQPVQTIVPPSLPPWVIKPKTEAVYKMARREKSAMAALNDQASAEMAVAEAPPARTENATFSVWSLGKKSIPAGSRQRFKIKEEAWPAEFIFLARPSQSPQAFLQARLKLAAPMEIPPGQASYIIDGALAGKRSFSLADSEADISFGPSPFITVNSVTTTDKSGTTNYLQSKQTRQWQWRLEAKNAGAAPVKLRIEEPIPQARDEKIKLTFQHNPEPSEQDIAKFIWFLDLPALQKKNIETSVRLEAPKDMNLDFGWRY